MELVLKAVLDAEEEYIVQQCCCTARSPHGLSEAIAKKWPYADPYKRRRRFKNNWIVLADRPQPGSIVVLDADHDKKVICLFGQYYHGVPGQENTDPLRTNIPDSPEDRLEYFKSGLEQIAKLAPAAIAVPYRIGCGLAGGHWPDYEKVLTDWSEEHPHIRVKIYKISE